MSRLRHPIRAIREPFGKAGLVVAVIALVAAVGGTALAAGGLTKSQEKQVTKIAKKYAGKPGVAGPAGPVGPAGTNGTNGKDGSNGAPGSLGAPGAPGKSVVAQPASGCTEGGTEFEVEDSGVAEEVCNGEEGPAGPEGVCSSAGCVLPSGVTETGAWAFGGTPEIPGEHSVRIPLSFPIPLPAEIANANSHINLVGFPTENKAACEALSEPEKATCLSELTVQEENCPGTALVPEAKAGHFCVYASSLVGEPEFPTLFQAGALGNSKGASVSGAELRWIAAAGATGRGTFAVTAP